MARLPEPNENLQSGTNGNFGTAMNSYILGIDHGIQLRGGLSENSHDEFEKLLREIIRERAVTFIGDETFAKSNAVAKAVAMSLDILWEPIEMPVAMRAKRGIADEQKKRPFDDVISDVGVVTRRYRRVPSDSVREDFMVERAIAKAGTTTSILILCGFNHAPQLQARFAKLGHQVTLDSLCKRSWYKHPDCE